MRGYIIFIFAEEKFKAMYKNVLGILILLISFGQLSAQGIDFMEGSWKEVVEKAQKEDKLIYMDAFAVWCGPCKMMAKNIFPDPQVGEKYNELFVNYSVDAEKGEGIDLAKQYKVTAYPTHLYINPHTQEVVTYQRGATDVNGFLRWASIAESEFRDSVSLKDYQQEFKKGNRAEEFLVKYINKAALSNKTADEALDAFVDLYVQDLTQEKWNFIVSNTKDLTTKSAQFIKQVAAAQKNEWAPAVKMQYDQWFGQVFNETVKNAIITKNKAKVIAVSESIKGDENFPHFFNLPYDLLDIYYQNIKDEKGLEKNKKAALNSLANKSNEAYDLHVSTLQSYVRNMLRVQVLASNPNVTEVELNTAVEESLATVKIPDLKEEKGNELIAATKEVILQKEEKSYKDAIAWNRKAKDIVEKDNLIEEIEKQYLVLLVLDNQKRTAQKIWNKHKKEGKIQIEKDFSEESSYDYIINSHLKI